MPAWPPSPEPPVRVSEIGQWTYCRRAWWLASQGYSPDNRAALAAGRAAHEHHGRQVATSLRLQRLAILLGGLGFLLLLATLLIGRS
jgi:hypothetical protein